MLDHQYIAEKLRGAIIGYDPDFDCVVVRNISDDQANDLEIIEWAERSHVKLVPR